MRLNVVCNLYCEFASLLGSLVLCGKLPCDNHAARVEVKAVLLYEGEKKTLHGGRGKALPRLFCFFGFDTDLTSFR